MESMNSFRFELKREDATRFPANNQEQLHTEASFSTNNPNQIPNTSFFEIKEEIKADKARQILGLGGENITDDQLGAFVAQLELLINSWLDSYEKQLFDGKTLREITK